ncbi:MAG: hypothetical protein JJT95_15930 [Pararhodobacter sp.]|nr:hypothetical protein [Pararhodobacter sp.]
MSNSCEKFADGVLEALAAYQGTGALENGARIVRGFFPNWDEEHGTVALSHESGPDNLLRVEGKATGEPRWLTLNFDLGGGDFEPGDVIGVVADVEGDGDYDLEMFIRTRSDEGNIDTEFPEGLSVSAGRRVVNSMHTVGMGDGVVTTERFHMLIIRLPKRDFRLEIREMRFFVLPASHGLRSASMSLASASA